MSQFWPSCISGTSHTPCREVLSALLPVRSTVSPAYKNFSCSPSFFSSSFLFSFLVFCLVHQSKSQVSSQVRSRLLKSVRLEFCSAIASSQSRGKRKSSLSNKKDRVALKAPPISLRHLFWNVIKKEILEDFLRGLNQIPTV